jgi:ketosteroid isomerase-like protein
LKRLPAKSPPGNPAADDAPRPPPPFIHRGILPLKDHAMSKMFLAAQRARALVKSFYEGGARGEITSFADSLSDDFELFVPPQLPWGGTFNKQQYIELLPRVASALDFARMKYLSLTAEGQHVVALIEIGVQGTNTSIIISEHWEVRDEKAVRLLVAYFDPTPLLRQAAA